MLECGWILWIDLYKNDHNEIYIRGDVLTIHIFTAILSALSEFVSEVLATAKQDSLLRRDCEPSLDPISIHRIDRGDIADSEVLVGSHQCEN